MPFEKKKKEISVRFSEKNKSRASMDLPSRRIPRPIDAASRKSDFFEGVAVRDEDAPRSVFAERGVDDLKHGTLIKRALIGITLVSAAIVAGGIFFLFNYGFGGREISISIIPPDKIERGVPFEVSVEIKNGADAIIADAELKVSASPGIVALNGESGARPLGESIGSLGGGSLAKKTFRFLPVTEPGSRENIRASLGYSVGGGTRFEATETKNISIADSAIEISVKKPEKIIGGSEFVIRVDYENKSDFDFPSVAIRIQYPAGFNYTSSGLKPEKLNNEWRLGELGGRSKGSLEITGALDGSGEDLFSFPVVILAEFYGKEYPIAEDAADLNISASPILLDVVLGDGKKNLASLSEGLEYKIHYQNLSGIGLRDVSVRAELSGEMFDFASLVTGGLFDLSGKTIFWDASAIPELRFLDPGASGEVSFFLRTKAQYPILRLNDKNFYLKVFVELSSPSVPLYVSAERTRAISNMETKVAGLVTVDARAFYRDAAAGIINAGLLPPTVDAPTEFTIHWVIRNFSTDVKDLVLRSVLPLGVSWTGIAKSNFGDPPIFNPSTREVFWSTLRIPATKGVVGDPIDIVFQIEATPSLGYISAYLPLLGETALMATDEFTGESLSAKDSALTTELVDDPTVSRENGRVVP